MNDLIVVQKIAGWEKLKALVLDSVSSPITKRVMALGRVPAMVPAGAAARLHQGYRERVACIAGGPGLARRRSSFGCRRFASWPLRPPTTSGDIEKNESLR